MQISIIPSVLSFLSGLSGVPPAPGTPSAAAVGAAEECQLHGIVSHGCEPTQAGCNRPGPAKYPQKWPFLYRDRGFNCRSLGYCGGVMRTLNFFLAQLISRLGPTRRGPTIHRNLVDGLVQDHPTTHKTC